MRWAGIGFAGLLLVEGLRSSEVDPEGEPASSEAAVESLSTALPLPTAAEVKGFEMKRKGSSPGAASD